MNSLLNIVLSTMIAFNPVLDIETNELYCMTENLYHEARGQTIVEQQNVLRVVMASAKRRGTTLCEEIHRPARYSWTINEPIVNDLNAWKNVAEVAAVTMVSDLGDWTAEFYHDYSVNPSWNKDMTVVYRGPDLIFYNN